ncbi:vicilin-like seed storage protein At2g18540 [Salvia miltiorrhiza]|uniref:vicilin-like seed storage protein At2g18540 n=1 Tax=Salvia miltiorrhiza TaxID=226208 RepID=UPI0025AD8CD6|nr:vicilin-like seed storage protein At2g18540 [Salvia miltiorrhiza]
MKIKALFIVFNSILITIKLAIQNWTLKAIESCKRSSATLANSGKSALQRYSSELKVSSGNSAELKLCSAKLTLLCIGKFSTGDFSSDSASQLCSATELSSKLCSSELLCSALQRDFRLWHGLFSSAWAFSALHGRACNGGEEGEGFVVRRGERRVLVSTENGEIVGARVGTSYLLHFFTMEPNSLFLPVILHSDMFFYVHTGSGKLLWTEENELKTADLRRGDVYRLKAGAAFFIQSNLETETQRQKLRIHSIFPNTNTDMHEPPTGPYSSIRDMVLGFDKKVLQAAFKVPEEVIEELLNGTKPAAIIHGVSKSERRAWEVETKLLGSLLGSTSRNIFELSKKKGKKSSSKLFNLFKEDKDFENSNGWSTTVTGKKLSALKGTNIGIFMVNLTRGSMMGPHWNPAATEIAIVVQGRGMVRVVCPSVSNGTGCSDMMRFEVEEGDLFVVPRFHPMAQMAFNNETFVFMGFSSSAKKNHPQFLAGQASVLRTLTKDMLATSFSVDITTMDRLLASQQDSVILGCVSCADEEFRIVEEEREKAREREEEEARKREEEAREREAREREEERRKEEEEARKREEEEAKRQEEERKRREEEEEREEERRREEEEAREREEEEAKRQEEERKRREEGEEREEEEAREREEEEAKRQEEERKRREEEEEREEEKRREEEEEAKEREEEAARKKREEEEEEEEAARREEGERRRQEEEERKREEEAARRQEEERQRREEEEEERRRQRAAAKRREEEERQRQEEEEEEMARREEEERQRREEKEEEEEERRRRGKEEEQERWSEEEEAAEEERRREHREEHQEE